MRIDLWLRSKYPQHSRNYLQFLILNNHVLVNCKPVSKSYSVSNSDVVDVNFVPTAPSDVSPENIPITVLYEDSHILVVDKPPNMVVHPAPGNWSGTFVNALLNYCDLESGCSDVFRPGIVHRLDKETSGVMIAAKTLASRFALNEAFANRKINKTYVALAEGSLGSENLTVDVNIGRDKSNRQRMIASNDPEFGKPAVTIFNLIDKSMGVCLIEARTLTGRQHQIRVHLKHIGMYLLGESKYKSRRGCFSRHMLHAYCIEFEHPVYKNTVKVRAGVPNDFKTAAVRNGLSNSIEQYC